MGITDKGMLRLINNCLQVLNDGRFTQTQLDALREKYADKAVELKLKRLQSKVSEMTLEHHAPSAEIVGKRFAFCGIGATRNEVENYDSTESESDAA